MSEWILIMCLPFHQGFYSECYVIETYSTEVTCMKIAEDMNDVTPKDVLLGCGEQSKEDQV